MTKDEERAKRVHDLLYSTDDRADLCERIVSLEDAVEDMRAVVIAYAPELVDLLDAEVPS